MLCPDEETLLAFLGGQLSAPMVSEIDAHLAGCGVCSQLVADVAPIVLTATAALGRPPAAAASPVTLARGVSVGRYVLLDLVGSGGMGEVYAAYDPELDRKVALKLLHENAERQEDAVRARARLLREAKAIARLSHPNVVVVYDAGTIGDRVFIAMELVEGSTVAKWLLERRRTWREIRDVFLAAGRGLEAAHAARIVHRDFKPHNVMVGAGGAVRVMDFGLANEAGAAAALADRGGASASEAAPLALTRTGTLLGTPAYMAPEQFRGEPADARTDQFSFCVALHEALYGDRPFPADSLPVLIEAVTSGRVREPPQKAAAPAWIRKAIVRGLRPDPAQRWPSMTDLLAALGRDPQRRGWQALAAAGIAAVLLGGGAAAQQMLGRRGEALCRGAQAKLAGIWDPSPGPGAPRSSRRDTIRAAFMATGLSFAGDTWERASALLDRHAARWTAAYAESCRATHVRGEQSAEVLDLRMDCLNRDLGGLRALTDVFASADREVVIGALNAASEVGDLARCDDVAALRAVVPLPRDAKTRDRVQMLRGRVAELKALAGTGKDTEALARGEHLLPALRDVGYDPLLAEALTAVGLADREVGNAAMAERCLEEAVTRGLAGHDDEAAVQATAILGGTIAHDFGRAVDSERWLRLGDALLIRLGPGHERTRAWLENGRASLREIQGRTPERIAALRQAVALKETALGPDHVDVAISLEGLSLALIAAGDVAHAVTASDRVLSIATKTLGAGNPDLGRYLSNRGEVLAAAGRPAESVALFRRALDLWEPLGPDNPLRAYPLTGLGQALLAMGKPEEAIAPLDRALVLRRTAKDLPFRLGETRFALARSLWDGGGDRGRARTLADEARADFAATPPNPAQRDEIDRWLSAHPAAAPARARSTPTWRGPAPHPSTASRGRRPLRR